MRGRVVLAVLGAAVSMACATDYFSPDDYRLVVVPAQATVSVGQSVTFRTIEGVIHDWSLVADLGNHPTQGAVGLLDRGGAELADVRISADGRELTLAARRRTGQTYPLSVWLGTRQILTSVDSVGQWIKVTITEP